jgi:hypothetical protein
MAIHVNHNHIKTEHMAAVLTYLNMNQKKVADEPDDLKEPENTEKIETIFSLV